MKIENGEYLYITRGDFAVNLKSNISKTSTFPLNHYHGITISIDLDHITKDVFRPFSDIEIDLYQLKNKLCGQRGYMIMRENEKIEHIFSELYDVPEKIRKGYFKIKVIEMLLVLSVMEEIEPINKKYCLKKQVDIIKAIREYLVNHLEQKITIEQLSKQFQMPATTMKLLKKALGNHQGTIEIVKVKGSLSKWSDFICLE